MIGTIYFIAPRWARLRSKTGIQSPTEYLATRYNIPTQQLMAWSGVVVKLFDVGAKWAAVGILLHAFMGIPVLCGIVISGVVPLFYVSLVGLWADELIAFTLYVMLLVPCFVYYVTILS